MGVAVMPVNLMRSGVSRELLNAVLLNELVENSSGDSNDAIAAFMFTNVFLRRTEDEDTGEIGKVSNCRIFGDAENARALFRGQ